MQLGMIPAWQFSTDPAVNFTKINPHVTYPDGVYQTTIQPLGPWFNVPPPAGMSGLGVQPQPAFRGPKGVQLLGLGDFSSLGGIVTGIGSFLVLALAAFGGYKVYEKLRK